MGIQAMVKGFVGKAKGNITTNARSFREFSRRMTSIAQDLDTNGDTTQQQEFQALVMGMNKELGEVSGNVPDNISSRMAPGIYSKRKDIILSADQMLNRFKAPPQGHSEAMRKATLADENSLGFQLDNLKDTKSAGLLRDISEPVGIGKVTDSSILAGMTATSSKTKDKDQLRNGELYIQTDDMDDSSASGTRDYENSPRSPSPERECGTLDHQLYKLHHKKMQSQPSGSTFSRHEEPPVTRMHSQFSEGGLSIQSERAHAQFEKNLIAVEQGSREPSFNLPISDMCTENGETTMEVIPLDHTFGELADTVLDRDNDAPLPDFWAKKVDRTQNGVTPSGVFWEWQDPSTKVIDVIMKKKDGKKESMCIEMVSKDGEYVVALVEKDEQENGMPIDLPRKHRQPASVHLQKVFPKFTVAQVLGLKDGEDVSEKLFDRRLFQPMTNSVYIKVHTATDEDLSEKAEPVKSALGMEGIAMNPITIVRDKNPKKGKGSESPLVEDGMVGVLQGSRLSKDGN